MQDLADVRGHYSLELPIAIGLTLEEFILRVSQIAKRSGLSRTAILYYEACGLLKPALRSSAKYHLYGNREVQVLDQIRVYRPVGMSVAAIRLMLSSPENEAAALLKCRLREPEDSTSAWASGGDPAAIARQGNSEEDYGNDQGEVGGNHEGRRILFGGHASLAVRVRTCGSRLAPRVPAILAYLRIGD